ncbi:DNase I-like protein [Xylaria scruposa]|nr:DNase I-like protein [Xylaria scruposa]
MASNPRFANRNISPPPIRRHCQHLRTETSLSAKLRISAWNVNGIAPFVTPYLRRQPQRDQHDIRSFFRADPRGMAKKRKRGDTGNKHESTDSDDDNGPQQNESAGDEPSLRRSLERLGWPHIICLQEIKIKRGDVLTMNAVRAAVNDTRTDLALTIDSSHHGGPAYDVHFNLPCDLHNAKGFGGRVYGVATVVRRRFARAHIETVRNTRDLTFSLAIINIYAVNGTSNPYRSSEGSVIGTRHDRKLAVHYELLREARRLEDRGFAVVIAGDLNVARDARDGYPNLRTWPPQHVVSRRDFNKKFFSDGVVGLDPGAERVLIAEHSNGGLPRRGEVDEDEELVGFNGIDTFRAVHGDERRYSYYPRGRHWGSSCDRVDLVIASRALGWLLVDADICDNSRDRGPSDHCPVWAEHMFGSRRKGVGGKKF